MTSTLNGLERKIQTLHFVSTVLEISKLETWENWLYRLISSVNETRKGLLYLISHHCWHLIKIKSEKIRLNQLQRTQLQLNQLQRSNLHWTNFWQNKQQFQLKFAGFYIWSLQNIRWTHLPILGMYFQSRSQTVVLQNDFNGDVP